MYNNSTEDHIQHLRKLFRVLTEAELYTNPKKCTFLQGNCLSRLRYQGRKVGMEPKKTEAIQSWPVPTSIKEVQAFLGLASFYRRFIRNFSSIVAPLTDCLKKENYKWNGEQQQSFEEIKRRLTSSPILQLPDFASPFEVAVDACRTGIGAVLSQQGHPIEYFSEKLCTSR